MRVLIDASNLRSGGGVQVASSLIDEWAGLYSAGNRVELGWLDQAVIITSTAVAQQVGELGHRIAGLKTCDRRWRTPANWLGVSADFDVSLVVFGPEYGRRRADHRIVGFADGTSVHPRPVGTPTPRPATRLRGALRGVVSRALFRRADQLVVESESVRQRLIDCLHISPAAVTVVPNSYNGVYDKPETWKPLPLDVRALKTSVLLNYACRAYPHKNLGLLAEIRSRLTAAYGLDVRFVVTLSEEEWRRQSYGLRGACINVGPLEVCQCPELYLSTDGAIFPSLLESFSATPLEAMRMGRVLFASDREFVRTACGDAPVYFDPLDASSAAFAIAKVFSEPEFREAHVRRGLEVVTQLPTARDRALAYARLISAVAT